MPIWCPKPVPRVADRALVTFGERYLDAADQV